MKSALLVIALIHLGSATLLIRGPTSPVLEGDTVTVECLLQDSEYNTSDVRFQYFSSYRKTWRAVRERFGWCGFGRMPVNRTEDRVILTVLHASRGLESFRCVIDGTNATAPEDASKPLAFPVHYLTGPHLSRDNNRYYWYRSVPEDLSVRSGTDVVVNCSVQSSETTNIFWYKEGSDWILPSSVLTLEKVSDMDKGRYTCSAKHPTIPSLSKSRSFNLTVLYVSERTSWFQTTDEKMLLMTILVPVVTCLLLILAVSVFLYRRAKKIHTSKGPIDDHSQKKPIYTSSTESVPITCGESDKQPLV